MHSPLNKVFLFTFLLISLLPFSAYAHRLNIFVEVNGQDIVVNSYYSGGAKCKECKVEVYSDSKKIKEGKTDERGIFLFKIELPIKLKIIVFDKMGHRAEYEMNKDELSKQGR